MENITQILNAYQNHQDSLEWLSNACVLLAGHLYSHNTQMATAERLEAEKTVAYLNSKEIKTVAEAQRRAVVDTENKLGELKGQGKAIEEIINAIKTRIRVLEAERGFAKIN